MRSRALCAHRRSRPLCLRHVFEFAGQLLPSRLLLRAFASFYQPFQASRSTNLESRRASLPLDHCTRSLDSRSHCKSRTSLLGTHKDTSLDQVRGSANDVLAILGLQPTHLEASARHESTAGPANKAYDGAHHSLLLPHAAYLHGSMVLGCYTVEIASVGCCQRLSS